MKKRFLKTAVAALCAGLALSSLTANGTAIDPDMRERRSTELLPAGSWSELQSAIDKASINDQIRLADNLNGSSANDAIRVKSGKQVIIDLRGCNIDRGRTSAVKNGSVIIVEKGAMLTIIDTKKAMKNAEIKGGWSYSGGGIENYGTFTASNLTITNCKTESGSDGDGAGAGIMNAGTLNLTDVKITGNSAKGGGGAIHNKYVDDKHTGSAVLKNCKLTDNNSGDGGAVFIGKKASAELQKTTVSNNKDLVYGGGGITNYGSLKVLDNSVIENNTCKGKGGGIYSNGTLIVKDSSISSNTSSNGVGGGIYNIGTLDIYNTKISGNSARDGAGIDNDNNLIMRKTSLIKNKTIYNGGGALVTKGTAEISENCLFEQNESLTRGGAIWTDGTTDISDTEFRINSAESVGGAIFAKSGATLTVRNSYFYSNHADLGGGIYLERGAAADLFDFKAESNNGSSEGGAIWSRSNRLFVMNCDVRDNLGKFGSGMLIGEGGIINFSGKCIVKNNGPSYSRSNVTLESTGETPDKLAVIYSGGLKKGSEIGINRDSASVRTVLVKDLREAQAEYFFGDHGNKLSYEITGEGTDIYMATAISPFNYALYILIALELIAAAYLLIPLIKKRITGRKKATSDEN